MDRDARFIPNTFAQLLTVRNTGTYLKNALEDIVTNNPPLDVYPDEVLHGVWSGPTGWAYLFLHVSVRHPKLQIADHLAIHWAQEYVRGSRGQLAQGKRPCGLAHEKMAFESVRAAVTKDLSHVKEAVSNVGHVLEDHEQDNEMMYGRAGTLYLLRIIRHWVPNSAPLVERAIVMVTNRLMAEGPDWTWRGEHYLGAVHGDIAIMTQLVLTTPPLAPSLVARLDQLLDMQQPGGNWPASKNHPTNTSLVQFCHGAPGIVISLLSLRPYFPKLEAKLDKAIQAGRECIWREGLLRKNPNLCHGIFSNALALPRGSQRDHFLALATPEKVAEMRRADPTVFEPADYGKKYATLMSYTTSAAWTWMVFSRECPRIILYNEV